jgi:hypothetical protein
MTNNKLFTIFLAGLCGIIVSEAYEAGRRDGSPILTVVSSDLPADDPGETPESAPDPDNEPEG